jgi:hypothetical protein
MAKFEILGQVMLGFLTRNSYDAFIEPGQGHLEFDSFDIVWVKPDGSRLTSVTVNHALDIWCEQGLLRRLD